MDNSQSIWRIRAKVVAYADLVLLCIGLLLVIVLAVLSAGITAAGASVISNSNNQGSSSSSSMRGYGWYSGTRDTNDFRMSASDSQAVSGLFTFAAMIIWIIVGVVAMLTGVQIWAALKLLSASEIGKDPKDVVRKARTWRNVSIVFLVFAVIGCFTISFWYFSIFVAYRAGFIFIVYSYIKELEDLITGAFNSYPVNVIVAK